MPSFQKASRRRWIGGQSRKYRELFDYGENAPNKKKKRTPKKNRRTHSKNGTPKPLPRINPHAKFVGQRGRVAWGHCSGQSISSLSNEALAGCLWHAEHGVGGSQYLDDLRAEVARRR